MKAPQWIPETDGFTKTMDGIAYRAGRFPVDRKRDRFAAWAGSRLIGESPKLAAAKALCERAAARRRTMEQGGSGAWANTTDRKIAQIKASIAELTAILRGGLGA